MASPTVDTFFGGTLAFTTSTMMNALEIFDLNWSGAERPVVDVTHAGSGAATANEIGNADGMGIDIGDPGAFDVDYHFNPDVAIPLTATRETVTLTWPSGAIWTFLGCIQSISGAFPIRDKMAVTVSIKVCGPITRTAAP